MREKGMSVYFDNRICNQLENWQCRRVENLRMRAEVQGHRRDPPVPGFRVSTPKDGSSGGTSALAEIGQQIWNNSTQ